MTQTICDKKLSCLPRPSEVLFHIFSFPSLSVTILKHAEFFRKSTQFTKFWILCNVAKIKINADTQFFTSLTSNCSECETDLYRRKEARGRSMNMNYNTFSEKKMSKVVLSYLKRRNTSGDSCLHPWHLGGCGRRIATNLRPAWATSEIIYV